MTAIKQGHRKQAIAKLPIKENGERKRTVPIRKRAIAVLPDGTNITLDNTKKNPKVSALRKKEKRPLHPAMVAKMWKPGQSGNPKGAPKRKGIAQAYKELLGMKCSLPGYEHMTWEEAVAFGMGIEAVLGGTVGGSVAAARELREGSDTKGAHGKTPKVIVQFGKDGDGSDQDTD